MAGNTSNAMNGTVIDTIKSMIVIALLIFLLGLTVNRSQNYDKEYCRNDTDDRLGKGNVRRTHDVVQQHGQETESAVNHNRGHQIPAEYDRDRYSYQSYKKDSLEYECHCIFLCVINVTDGNGLFILVCINKVKYVSLGCSFRHADTSVLCGLYELGLVHAH